MKVIWGRKPDTISIRRVDFVNLRIQLYDFVFNIQGH